MISNAILIKQYVFHQYLSHHLKDFKNDLNNMMDPTIQKLNPDFKPHYNFDRLLTLIYSALENPEISFMV